MVLHVHHHVCTCMPFFSLVEPSLGATSEKHQPVQATAEELTKLTHNLKIRVNKNIQYDREEDD